MVILRRIESDHLAKIAFASGKVEQRLGENRLGKGRDCSAHRVIGHGGDENWVEERPSRSLQRKNW